MPNLQYILVVDDDSYSADLLAQLLERKGYQVVRAADGLEALEYLETQPCIDLIILDMNMPRMDGATLLRIIRQDARFRQLPVIVVSGSPQLVRDRVQAVLRKPIAIESLLSVIRKNLSNHYSSQN